MSFQIARGTNISHFLSQSDKRGKERRDFFTKTDVRRIASWGLDHIRLPIDEEQMWTDTGKREPEAFELMNAVIDWCFEANLKVVVDLHILRSHYFMNQNPPLFTEGKEADKFATLWTDLSKALHSRSEDKLAYELMNEPVAQNDADWNRVFRYPLAAIRSREATRTVVLGSNKWSQCATFDTLDVPADDKNLLLTFHFYNPMLVTHYRAKWVPHIAQYTGPIHYPGKQIHAIDFAALPEKMRLDLEKENRPYDAAAMERDLAKPLAVAARTGLPLYCGEFGVVKNAPDAVRISWYRDIRFIFKKYKIAWANWDFKGGFGLIDSAGSETAAKTGLLD